MHGECSRVQPLSTRSAGHGRDRPESARERDSPRVAARTLELDGKRICLGAGPVRAARRPWHYVDAGLLGPHAGGRLGLAARALDVAPARRPGLGTAAPCGAGWPVLLTPPPSAQKAAQAADS